MEESFEVEAQDDGLNMSIATPGTTTRANISGRSKADYMIMMNATTLHNFVT